MKKLFSLAAIGLILLVGIGSYAPTYAAATISYITLPLAVTSFSVSAGVDKALPNGTVIQLSTGDTMEVGVYYTFGGSSQKFTARLNSAASFTLTAPPPSSVTLASGSILKIYMNLVNTSNPSAAGATVRTFVPPTTTTTTTTTTNTTTPPPTTTTTTIPVLPGGKVPNIVNSGGLVGHDWVDVKGEPAVGSYQTGSTKLGIGWIYMLTEAGNTTPEVPAGTVKLYISRNGDNINLTWEASMYGTNPDIYILTGSGSGEYQNTYDANKWKIYSDALFAGKVAMSPGLLVHSNQVGAVSQSPEVYYKGLRRNIGTDRIQSAEAVGKADVVVGGGRKWTLFSMPFMDAPSDLNQLLGTQADYAAGIDATSSVRIFSHELGGWNRASYFDGTSWLAVGGLSAAIYDGDKGLYMLTRTGDPDNKFTLIGRVKQLTATTSYAIKPNWNVVGLPYPVKMDINNIALTGGTRNDNPDLADRIYGHINYGFNACSYLKSDGTWAPLPGVAGFSVINAKPMYYRSKSGNDVNWEINPASKGYN